MSGMLSWALLGLVVTTQFHIERMGDDRFLVREAASNALKEMVCQDCGILILPMLDQATRHGDPEIAKRAALVRSEFFNVRATSRPDMPWIDMLPSSMSDRHRLLSEYLFRAREEVGHHSSPDWYDYRLATVYLIHDQLRAGVPRSQVIDLLNQMVENQARYLSRR